MEREEIFQLVKKAKEGDSFAFESIYKYYFAPIFRYIFCKVTNWQEAEDLTQEVFLKAFEKISNFKIQKEKNSFTFWLYKIAKNKVIDYYKKKKDVFLSNSIEKFEKEKTKSPLFEIEKQEKTNLVLKAIKELTNSQREVLILKFFNDLSNKEISKLLGKSEQAIRALQYRALKKIKEKLKNQI